MSSSQSSDSNKTLSDPKKTYKCPEKGCNASFTKNNKLTYHIRKHKNERPFVCNEPNCDKTYTNPSHLTRHKKVTHERQNTSESVICEYEGCSLAFANKYSLKKHCNLKHNGKNAAFTCLDCSQGFKKKRQLQEHMYIHTEEAAFQCDQCDMKFTTLYKMNKHKKRHKTYKCDCGGIFHQWSLLLAHRKSCRPAQYKCEDCGKEFTHLGNFKMHKTVHLEESEQKVYLCPYEDCKRFYFYKKNLKYHIDCFHKKIKANVFYSCTHPNCKLKLKTKKNLTAHLQRHFMWNKLKKRQERRDKGMKKKPKESMASILTGIKDDSLTCEETQFEDKNCDTADEAQLKQCDTVLQSSNVTPVEAK